MLAGCFQFVRTRYVGKLAPRNALALLLGLNFRSFYDFSNTVLSLQIVPIVVGVLIVLCSIPPLIISVLATL